MNILQIEKVKEQQQEKDDEKVKEQEQEGKETSQYSDKRKTIMAIIIRPSSCLLCLTLCSVLLVIFFVKRSDGAIVSTGVAETDIDIIMNDALDLYKIRGASVAFFDENMGAEPIVAGYGRIASSGSSAPVTADTSFTIASVSKVFVGTAVLILLDQGRITSLDDDICDVLPPDYANSACRNPAFPNVPVTWRMLVTHRSSLRGDIPSIRDPDTGDWVYASYGPTGGYADGSAAGGDCPLTDAVGFYRDFMIDKPTETSVGADVIGDSSWYDIGQNQGGGAWKKRVKPGQRRIYSNFAIGYVAALVEHLTGETFQSFCKQHIFDKLGMADTSWFREELPAGNIQAVPTEHIRRKRFRDVGHYCYIDYASGQLYTSAADIAKFLAAMNDNYGAGTLFSNAEIGKMAATCQERRPNGSVVRNCEFGTNWILLDNSQKDNNEFWLDPFLDLDWTDGMVHDGYEAGSQTQVLILPKAGLYLAVLTNTDQNGDWAAQDVVYDIGDVLGYGGRRRRDRRRRMKLRNLDESSSDMFDDEK